MREVRVSPDGNSVAIRSDNAEGSWNTYGVINAINGGHWADDTEVADWSPMGVDPDWKPVVDGS